MSAATFETDLPDAAATEALGRSLARAVAGHRAQGPSTVFLHGELGAGKTTLVQGMLRTLGVTGTIRSPSYTLLEPYDTSLGLALHADLYRLQGGRDVEALGLQDQYPHAALLLVEWPERAQGRLPSPDMQLWLSYQGQGRNCRLMSGSAPGGEWLVRLRASFSL